MKQLRIYPTSINDRFIEEAVETLRDGNLLIYPTDTVYAIGCDALNNSAIERICAIKGVDPRKQPLSVVCADISQASAYARIDNRAFALMKQYMPGAVTFILPASTSLPKVFKGRKTVGVRVPANPVAIALAKELGNPLLSMSARIDGGEAEEASEPDAVALAYDGKIGMMIDGGSCGGGLSTVVDLTDSSSPVVVRQGLVDFIQ